MKCLRNPYKECVTFSDCDHCEILTECIRAQEPMQGSDPRFLVIAHRSFGTPVHPQILDGTFGWATDNYGTLFHDPLKESGL